MNAILIHSVRGILLAVLALAAQTASAFYNPSAGRWLNRDPIGEKGGVNLSAFVANRPLMSIDRNGLDAVGVVVNPKACLGPNGRPDLAEDQIRNQTRGKQDGEYVIEVTDIPNANKKLRLISSCHCVKNLNLQGHSRGGGGQMVGSVNENQAVGAAFARAGAAVILGVALLAGCDEAPKVSDSSAIVVQPGYGVTNLCELGMTCSQIENATRDATIHGIHDGTLSWERLMSRERGRFVLIPSLGAIAAIGTDEPISSIAFYVQLYQAPLIPGLQVRAPFRGKLGDELSFGAGPITKSQVEMRFGTAERRANDSPGALGLRGQRQPFSHLLSNGNEEIWYPERGVAFVVESNLVKSFRIFRAARTNGGP